MINIVDVINEVVEIGNEDFAPVYKLNEKSFEIFKQYCKVIESLFEENDVKGFSAQANEDDMTMKLSFECSYFRIDNDTKTKAAAVFRRCLSMNVAWLEDELMEISFTFPPLWERA